MSELSGLSLDELIKGDTALLDRMERSARAAVAGKKIVRFAWISVVAGAVNNKETGISIARRPGKPLAADYKFIIPAFIFIRNRIWIRGIFIGVEPVHQAAL